MLDGLLQSKRFWLAAAGLVFVVLNEHLEVPVTQEQVEMVALIVASWIVGDSLRATKPK